MTEVDLRARQAFGLQAAAEVMERVFATFDADLATQIEELPVRQLGRLLEALESFHDCRAWVLEQARRAVMERLPDARQWSAEVTRLPKTSHLFHDVAERLKTAPPVPHG